MNRKLPYQTIYQCVDCLFIEDQAQFIKAGIYTSTSTLIPPPIRQSIFAANMMNAATTPSIYQCGVATQLAVTEKLNLNNSNTFVATNNNETTAASSDFNAAPPTPQHIVFKRVENQTGQMIAECEQYSGSNSYITFLIENNPLPKGITVNENGNIIIPTGLTIPLIINVNTESKKLFNGLNTGSTYYLYYAVVNNNGVSGISVGKSMLCG